MCRFVLYMGPPITLDLLITRPTYSIIHQSYRSRMREEPLNGDGFGVAWYVPEISPEPAVFRSIQPAWNNTNLGDLARLTRSPVILAHVRAASKGLSVSESNCHPFTAGPLAFMHNGSVAGFTGLKRAIQQRLSDESFSGIRGTTDSEHVFALFRDHYERTDPPVANDPVERLASALAATILEVDELARAANPARHSYLNLAASDGRCAAVSRFATGEETAPTLFVHEGKEYTCQDGQCLMIDSPAQHRTVIVASEPLTDEPTWKAVPEEHMALIHPDLTVSFAAIDG